VWRGYELQTEHVVGTYLQKYPDERQTWDELGGAAAEYNQLEAVGVSGATGVPVPESRTRWPRRTPASEVRRDKRAAADFETGAAS
jgi:hypothetical protein